LNTPAPVTLPGQHGRFVLLDFWTFCCANCLHVLSELRPLEAEFAEILTVVGIHSPKFSHEADPAAVGAAIERYEIEHPVLNDPALRLWQQYAVKAWPTLVLIDPEGYVVATAAGEGQVSALAATIRALAAEHEAKGTLVRGPAPSLTRGPDEHELRYPAKGIVLQSGNLLIADAGHHALAELDASTFDVVRRIGSGERDGPFAEPNGLALLPDSRVAVADTANHVVRLVDLEAGQTVATLDLPELLRGQSTVTGPIPDVLSPWDVVWWPAIDRLVVAAAGVHLLLAVDLHAGTAEVLAGTTVEGLKDGPALEGWLAQPSGLAVQGETLWFVDSETSALRYLTATGELHTAVGEGLFDFGHVDGPASSARLQHPLGLAVLPDRSIAIADTYNGAVRRYDPITGEVTTLAAGLAEPSGLVVRGAELLVVESAAHRLVPLDATPESVGGQPLRTQRPITAVAPGPVRLTIAFRPAPGRKLDDRYGPSTQLTVAASPLVLDGAGESTDLVRDLVLTEGTGVLSVTAQAASCDSNAEHPACYLARQDWGVPVRVEPGAPSELTLTLLG
jgi:thiol-disulfide isomerase/thioredoxin